MNRSTVLKSILAASFLLSLSVHCNAQPITANQLISGGTRCDHVIQMILRHGVNNSFNRGGTSSLLNQSPFGSVELPVSELGDLQIVQVNQLPSETNTCGPKFTVVVMNQSNRQVNNFHVAAVAVFGHINPFSPNCTVEVAKINAGEAIELTLALPVQALSMGNRNGEVLGFQKLIVAIDCYDELFETDEANNIKAFNSHEITVVTTVVSQAAISAIESLENSALSQSVSRVATAIAPTSNLSNISGEVSVDALDLDQPTPDSLRSAIRKVGVPAQTGSMPATQPGSLAMPAHQGQQPAQQGNNQNTLGVPNSPQGEQLQNQGQQQVPQQGQQQIAPPQQAPQQQAPQQQVPQQQAPVQQNAVQALSAVGS